jgi:hypothetical protein
MLICVGNSIEPLKPSGWQRESPLTHIDNLLVSVLGLATIPQRTRGAPERRCRSTSGRPQRSGRTEGVSLAFQKKSYTSCAKALCRSPDYADRKLAWAPKDRVRMGERVSRGVIHSA